MFIFHPALRPRAEVTRYRIHETAVRQSEHNPDNSESRHVDGGRVRALQEANPDRNRSKQNQDIRVPRNGRGRGAQDKQNAEGQGAVRRRGFECRHRSGR